MGMNSFAAGAKLNCTFKVKNVITNSNKTVRVFNYPIPVGTTRDLLDIPGISESDIRASLLKGELLTKILAKELMIIESDIDLLQFNSNQLAFLTQYGLAAGGSVQSGFSTQNVRSNILMQGNVDGYNNMFSCPNGDQFIYDTNVSISIYWNGIRQFVGSDYVVHGSNNDTVVMVYVPNIGDIITADYYIES